MEGKSLLWRTGGALDRRARGKATTLPPSAVQTVWYCPRSSAVSCTLRAAARAWLVEAPPGWGRHCEDARPAWSIRRCKITVQRIFTPSVTAPVCPVSLGSLSCMSLCFSKPARRLPNAASSSCCSSLKFFVHDGGQVRSCVRPPSTVGAPGVCFNSCYVSLLAPRVFRVRHLAWLCAAMLLRRETDIVFVMALAEVEIGEGPGMW